MATRSAPLDDPQKLQEALDRRIFYFKTLYEASQELGGVIQPRRILETFLLTTMGALGFAQGLAALVNARTNDPIAATRGLSRTDADRFISNLPRILETYYAAREFSALQVPRVQLIEQRSAVERALFPSETRVLVLWSVDEDTRGLLGFGSKISDGALGEEDLDMLLNLTNILVSALSRAFWTRNIQQLNADLEKKNAALHDALTQAQDARAELGRRVFHLKTLSDVTAELSPLIQTGDLLDTFLLATMGMLGIGQGFGLVYNRETKKVLTAGRGAKQPSDGPSAEAAEKLLYEAFGTSRERRLAPMSVARFEADPELFARVGVAIDVRSGLLYVVDQTLLGIIALGPKITGSPLSAEEEELLGTQSVTFLTFLKNARSFEEIQALNADLSQRNEELRKTIADLTEARHTIALLERARLRIRSLVQREVERMGRVSLVDLGLIVFLATALGILFNLASPQALPLLPETLFRPASTIVDAAQARTLLDAGHAVLVDARPKELYAQKHIQGAINVPPALFDFIYAMKLGKLDDSKAIIVYGRNISKRYDEEVAHRLKQRDHEKVSVLSGGLRSWESLGYPVE